MFQTLQWLRVDVGQNDLYTMNGQDGSLVQEAFPDSIF